MSCHELYMRGVSSCKNVQIVYLPGFTRLAVEARLIPVQTAGQGETRRDIQAITFTEKKLRTHGIMKTIEELLI